ncbi:hypothetical protein ACEVJL_09460 [Pseudoflavonifractor sp. P01025]|nr:hypothetical protein [Flintibacter sp.]
MWERLRKNHPGLYEALEWFGLGLSLVAAVLAGLTYWAAVMA